MCRQEDVLTLLKEKGANINTTNSKKQTAIYAAAVKVTY